jgi:hypothetical protein
MANDKKHLNNFIKNIFSDDYATAKDDLQSAIVEKLKDRMKTELAESSVKASKQEKGE